MRKWFLTILLLLPVLLVLTAPALAVDGHEADGEGGVSGKVIFFTAALIVAGVAQAWASSMAALAQGRAVSAAVEGIARQPSSAGEIFKNLILGLALIESLAIYVLLIAIVVLFMNPFKDLILG